MKDGHAADCRRIHAPDAYREAIAKTPPGNYRSHLEREMEQSAGIYLVICVDGCPHLERARERGRELAQEHGW